VAIGDRIKARLRALKDSGMSAIGDVRGPGAMIALELVHDGDANRPNPEATRAIVLEGANEGLLLLSCGLRGNVVRFLPALTMPDALLDEALDKLEVVLRRVLGA
jgi:4-aminobutyrate aminotransferase/(S)-3-amino-2-methylpropionate transaminase